MKNLKTKLVGIVHLGKREKSGSQILEKLKQYDFDVCEWDLLDSNDNLKGIENVDVIIVNIGNVLFDYDSILDRIFDLDLTVIINEALYSNKLIGNSRQSWERHLLHKVDSTFSVMPKITKTGYTKNMLTDLCEYGIEQVWILAASIGGPEAIQAFLSEFKGDEKILFIIIQHMDKEFVPMMQKQFSMSSNLKVEIPLSGMKIKDVHCLIHPVDEFISFQNDAINLESMNKVFAYTPCIDECTRNLVNKIKNINIAVFSGMSSDGVRAAELVKEKGNKVITQTEDSCVLSSIISGVKDKLTIDFDGMPNEMADYIIKTL